MAVKWDEKTDYSALINAAMESGSTDANYLQGLLDAREAKMQDDRWSQYNNPEYTSSVRDYINNINKSSGSGSRSGGSGGSGSSYGVQNGGSDDGWSANGLYRTDVDYAALINAAMESGSTDADYLQGLLNSRIAKTQNENWSKYADSDYNKNVQDYINSLRKPAFDLDSIMAQISDAIGSAPEYSSRWDDTANKLAQAALEMNYGDWTESDQYAALADRYGKQGQMSMQDVLGQIASRTGGLASSYAATVADQQYNEYMAMLEEVARQMYAGERSDALENAQLAMNYGERDYDRYLDDLAQWGNNRSFAYQVLSDAIANSQYDQEWAYKLEQNNLSNQQQAQSDAQGRIDNYLAAGGSVANLDPSLVETSGYTPAELAAMETYYAQQAAAAAAKSSGGSSGSKKSSGGSGSGSSSGEGSTSDKWSGVEAWVGRYGIESAEDYVKEHYKDLGYSSQSAALSGWNNHMLEIGGIDGLSSGGAEAGTNTGAGTATDPEITNRHGDSWVTITGMAGRYTYQELYNMVESGEVIEVYDANKNTVTYRKKTSSSSANGGR